MPLYEFLCETCGPLEQWRAFEEASNPMTCPRCGAIAQRVFSAPGLVRTPPVLAKALYRAEKSAHEPEVVTRQRPSRQEPVQPTIVRQQRGRPWMAGQ